MSLIDLGKLSEPATALINRVSDAIGGIAKLYQITRVAIAETKAEIARAHARVEILEIEERGLYRMVKEEGIRQANMEAVTASALPLLAATAKPDEVDSDWIVHLFDKARLISDADIQAYWAAMLAGEANTPGKFSTRTIDTLASMDKSDMLLFNKFANCVWDIDGPTALIFEIPSLRSNVRLSFDDYQHLEGLGLMRVQGAIGEFALEEALLSEIKACYFGKEVVIKFNEKMAREIVTGKILLTTAGKQLSGLCNPEPSDFQFERALKAWTDQGHYLQRLTKS